MNCPKCKKEHKCGCGSCKKSYPNEILSILNDDDTISCGYCGFTMHCDQWLDEESRQHDFPLSNYNSKILKDFKIN